jgi:hypothetical protein
MDTHKRAAVVAAAVLGADALVHLYWTTGATWPAADARTASMAVLNFEAPFTPPLLLPLVAMLILAAAAVLADAGVIGRPIPRPALRAITFAVAGAALARGVLGIVWAFGNGTDTWTPFYWLNVFLYTPACLVLCAAVMVARRARQGGAMAG